jgi:hypothetical protein
MESDQHVDRKQMLCGISGANPSVPSVDDIGSLKLVRRAFVVSLPSNKMEKKL